MYKGAGFGYNAGSSPRNKLYLVNNGRKMLAEIRPFRGTFYNRRIAGDEAMLVAPPYDIIDPEKKKQLAKKSPYNIVHLILPRNEGEGEFWKTSERLFGDWKRRSVLVPDARPCFYAYRQTFQIPGCASTSRLGLLTALKCKDFATGEVMPHEKTFSRTRSERLNLLRSCRANFSQIFMACRDDGREMMRVLARAAEGQAFLAFEDDEGAGHELWRIDDPEDMELLRLLLLEKRLIIADGHHRYETALAYSKESAGRPGEASDYVSAVIYSSHDPGLVILPVHRVLKRLPVSSAEMLEKVQPYFEARKITPGEASHGLCGLLRNGRRAEFIAVTAEAAFELHLRDVELGNVIKGPESEDWKNLDISILHSLLLGGCLGLDADRLAESGGLWFTPWEEVALEEVRGGRAEAAFLVRPTAIEDIWRIAEGGERMPHKSSYFHPKLPSGLVIYDHANAF
jgi:uncharacterized protein (DUF1015 family)